MADSRRILEQHHVASGEAGQAAHPLRLKTQSKLILDIVALGEEVQAVALARTINDNQRAVSRHELEVIDVGLNQAGGLRRLGRGLRRVARCHPWDPGGYDPP